MSQVCVNIRGGMAVVPPPSQQGGLASTPVTVIENSAQLPKENKTFIVIICYNEICSLHLIQPLEER